MTAFQRRFDPSFARLHKAIADGVVGDPISAILQSRDPSPPPFSYVKGKCVCVCVCVCLCTLG